MHMVSAGSPAPDFTLPDQKGNFHSLQEFTGQWLIVYFYPKDDTPGCTKEACSFRGAFPQFRQRTIAVVGISKDNTLSHKKFSDKFHLPFPLLSDTNKTTIKAYGVWGKKKFMGKEFEGILRTTFLIDPKGIVRKVYKNVNPDKHALEILQDQKSLLV